MNELTFRVPLLVMIYWDRDMFFLQLTINQVDLWAKVQASSWGFCEKMIQGQQLFMIHYLQTMATSEQMAEFWLTV